MRRNEKHWLTDEEVEYRTFGESLEDAVVEIRNMMPHLENAFSGIELMAVAVRAKELGFDRSSAFWPTSFPNEETFGMAWKDDDEVVADLTPPRDITEGWKLDLVTAIGFDIGGGMNGMPWRHRLPGISMTTEGLRRVRTLNRLIRLQLSRSSEEGSGTNAKQSWQPEERRTALGAGEGYRLIPYVVWECQPMGEARIGDE